MKRLCSVFGLGVFLFCVSCAAIEVKTDYDSTVNFDKYRTFDYMTELPQEPRLRSPPQQAFLDEKIKKAIDQTLTAKGYTMENENPDALITYSLEIEERQAGYTYYRYGRDNTYILDYQEGQLMINFLDAATKQLLWRGWAVKDIYNTASNQEEAQKRINEVVAKILEPYPPN